MALIFIGTPEFAVPSLRGLVEAKHDVLAVVTQPDRPAGRGRKTAESPAKRAAAEMNLLVLQPESLKDASVVEQVKALKPDVMVAVAYGQILRQEFLDIAPRGVLNVHPSLLPKYRGASPVPAAILAGDGVTGVTIMLMDAGMDSGPILAQREAPIHAEDTTASLTKRLAEEGSELLVETLPRWLTKKIKPKPQDASQVITTSLLKKEDGAIDWALSAVEIGRRVRAYNPWPGAFTHLEGALLSIWEARDAPTAGDEEPGTIIDLPAESGRKRAGFAIQTGEGVLIPVTVQREGRKRVSASEFLRGAPDIFGKRLE